MSAPLAGPGSLFEVPERLVGRYNRALEAAVGKRTSLTGFTIDRRGRSPEIADELGEDYLDPSPTDRYLIVVSPEQRRLALTRQDFSFDSELLDAVFDEYGDVIDVATRVDGLWGEIDDHVRVVASLEDAIAIRQVAIELRTPSRFIEHALELESCAERLRADPSLLLADDSALLRRIAALAETVGDVRDRGIRGIQVSRPVDSFHTRLFGGAWVLKNRASTVAADAVGGRRRDVLVIHGDDIARAAPAVQFLSLTDTQRVVDELLQRGLVRYEPDLVEVRLQQLEDEELARAGVVQSQLMKRERNRVLTKIRDRMPDVWRSLLDVQRELELGHPFPAIMARAPAEVRAAALSAVASGDESERVTASLLTRLWPYDYARMQRVDAQELRQVIARAPDWKRAHIAAVVR